MAITAFDPIRINGIEVSNRLVRSAHETLFHQGEIGDELINYHVARAKNGVGLSIVEATAIHYSSPGPGLMNIDSITHMLRAPGPIRGTGFATPFVAFQKRRPE